MAPLIHLSEIYPWYPATPRPGFRATIEDRPAGLSLATDVQVEIVDGRGEVTRLDHLFIQWHPRKAVDVTGWNPDRLDSLSRSLGLDEGATRDRVRSGGVSSLVDAILVATESTSEVELSGRS